MITDSRIDNGKSFDWGKVSREYAKYRDIYPKEFYEKIHSLGLCTEGQYVLDLGTGTGVLPRNMYKYGAKFIGSDISENQIEFARILSAENNMDIEYFTSSAEDVDFPDNTFDVITACQCHFYFKHDIFAEKACKMLKKSGVLAFLYMAWLPFEDRIAGESEKIILRYNPSWSGCGETRHNIVVPDEYLHYFNVKENITFNVSIPFTTESWHGRIKACRGVGASLSSSELADFEKEHKKMLEAEKDEFNILHYCAMTVLEKK